MTSKDCKIDHVSRCNEDIRLPGMLQFLFTNKEFLSYKTSSVKNLGQWQKNIKTFRFRFQYTFYEYSTTHGAAKLNKTQQCAAILFLGWPETNTCSQWPLHSMSSSLGRLGVRSPSWPGWFSLVVFFYTNGSYIYASGAPVTWYVGFMWCVQVVLL